MRASADSVDRAGLLGVPVKRLHTVVWALAGLLAFIATVPAGRHPRACRCEPALSSGILLRSLAALDARPPDEPARRSRGAAVALGVLELGVAWNASSPLLIDPILGGGGRRRPAARRRRRAVTRTRPTRRRGRRRTRSGRCHASWPALREVRARPVGGRPIVLAVGVVLLPNLLPVDQSLKASAVLIYGILGISLVVLTGWAGQVSLGQVAFFAIGAAVGARPRRDWHLDLTIAARSPAAAVGAVAAVVVGLPGAAPARPLPGRHHVRVLAGHHVVPPQPPLLRLDPARTGSSGQPLLGRIDIDSPTAHLLRRPRRPGARGRSPSGASGAAAPGGCSSPSGRTSGRAGLRHQRGASQALRLRRLRRASPPSPAASSCTTSRRSARGRTSPARTSRCSRWWSSAASPRCPARCSARCTSGAPNGSCPIDLAAAGVGRGVLFVLLVLPGGLGSLLYGLRDVWLRWVAERHGSPCRACSPTVRDRRAPRAATARTRARRGP